MILITRAVVVYRHQESLVEMREYTNDVVATVARLEAQGYIIIEIIDIG